ncbi:MAG: oxidoreductase [Devosiaceae bacterium]
MNVTLDGKVIIITGAARGIGAAIARQAAQSGAEGLMLTDRETFLHSLDCPTETLVADLLDTNAASTICQAAIKRFGRIDGLVNAAGITTRVGLADATPAIWDQIMGINARAPFFLMAQVIADMRVRKAPGSIVNIQSMNAHCGLPELAVYSASKGALQTLTKNTANATMGDKIRVNGINLGWVDTQTERHLQEVTLGKGEGWMDHQAAEQPIGRFVSEDDAARLAVYLLSDASAPMTSTNHDLAQWVVGAP